MHQHVQKIVHHRKRQHRDRKHIGQLDQSVFKALLAVIEVSTRQGIVTAEKRPPHAARHAVIGASAIGRNEKCTWIANVHSLALRWVGDYRRRARRGLTKFRGCGCLGLRATRDAGIAERWREQGRQPSRWWQTLATSAGVRLPKVFL